MSSLAYSFITRKIPHTKDNYCSYNGPQCVKVGDGVYLAIKDGQNAAKNRKTRRTDEGMERPQKLFYGNFPNLFLNLAFLSKLGYLPIISPLGDHADVS